MAVVILRIDQQFSPPCLRSCYTAQAREFEPTQTPTAGWHACILTIVLNQAHHQPRLTWGKEGWDTLSYTVCVQPLITQSQTTGGEWKWSAVSEGVRTHAATNCCFTGQWDIRQGRCLCSPFKHCWPPIQWRINLVAQVAYATGPAFSRAPH